MNIEKIIKEELEKLKLDQKIEDSLKNDLEIKKIILNERRAEQVMSQGKKYPNKSRVQPLSKELQDMRDLGAEAGIGTNASAGIASVISDASEAIGDLSKKAWIEIRDDWLPAVKYSDSGARIVWGAFMKLPEVQKNGKVRPVQDPNFGKKENEIILEIGSFIKEKFCKDNLFNITPPMIFSIVSEIKEKMQNKFPELKDEYFRDFAGEENHLLSNIWKMVRAGLNVSFSDKVGGDASVNAFKTWSLEKKKRSKAPKKKDKSACSVGLDNYFSDDMIKHLMVCVLNISFSNEGVNRADISKFPNLESMIKYYRDEFLKYLPTGEMDPRRIQQFKNWIGEKTEIAEEESKSLVLKSVETIGWILMWTIPFQIGRGAAFVLRLSNLLKIADPRRLMLLKGFQRFEHTDFALWFGMMAYNFASETEMDTNSVIEQLDSLLTLLDEDVNEEGPTLAKFESFKKKLKDKSSDLEKQLRNALYIIQTLRKAILKKYAESYSSIKGTEFSVSTLGEVSKVLSLEHLIDVMVSQEDSPGNYKVQDSYNKFVKQVKTEIGVYNKLNKKIKDNLKINIDMSKLIDKRITNYGQPGPDGSTRVHEDILKRGAIQEKKRAAASTMSGVIPGASNFTYEEFRCKDEAQTPVPKEHKKNVETLAAQLQIIREKFGPMWITSGYRTAEYNSKIKGVKASQHLKAKAADIRPGKDSKKTSDQLYKLINGLMVDGKIKPGGLGYYDNFVHYDIRRAPARWGDKAKIAAALNTPAEDLPEKYTATSLEGPENDTADPISKVQIPARAQVAACTGESRISSLRDLENVFSFILKGGKYCDYGEDPASYRGRNLYTDIATTFAHAPMAQTFEMSTSDYRREVAISGDIKDALWEHIKTRVPLNKKSKVHLDGLNKALYEGTSVIYGLNFGGLVPRGEINKVFNIGYVEWGQQQKQFPKAFCFQSGIETWSRSSVFIKAAKGGEIYTSMGTGFGGPFLLAGGNIKTLDSSLFSLIVRLDNFLKFVTAQGELGRWKEEPEYQKDVVIRLCKYVKLACEQLRSALATFVKTPSATILDKLMGPGQVISTLARYVDSK
jgi:hypothetical protein